MCCVATHMHIEKRRETGELVRNTKYLIKFLDCAAVLFSSYLVERKHFLKQQKMAHKLL